MFKFTAEEEMEFWAHAVTENGWNLRDKELQDLGLDRRQGKHVIIALEKGMPVEYHVLLPNRSHDL